MKKIRKNRNNNLLYLKNRKKVPHSVVVALVEVMMMKMIINPITRKILKNKNKIKKIKKEEGKEVVVRTKKVF